MKAIEKWKIILVAALCMLFFLSGCAPTLTDMGLETEQQVNAEAQHTQSAPYTADTPITEVQNDPVFADYGRLLFPVERTYMRGDTLGELGLTWYNNIDPDETVRICNTLHDRAASGETIFYDIYSDAEKRADPDKENTGLFFFRGEEGRRLLSVMLVGPSSMSAPCRTVFRMCWQFRSAAIMPSH